MTLPILIALLIVAFLVFGPIRKNFKASAKTNHATTHARLQHLDRTLVFGLIALFVTAYVFAELTIPGLIWVVLILMALNLGIAGYIKLTLKLTNHGDDLSFREALRVPRDHYWNKTITYVCGVGKSIAPGGWSDLKFDILSLDRKITRFSLAIFGLVVASPPVILAIGAVLMFWVGQSYRGPGDTYLCKLFFAFVCRVSHSSSRGNLGKYFYTAHTRYHSLEAWLSQGDCHHRSMVW